jgi:hypothetical protein
MFKLCVLARVLWMNSSMYTVRNVGVPVICIGVSLQAINQYIVVIAVIFVMFVIRHSVSEAI